VEASIPQPERRIGVRIEGFDRLSPNGIACLIGLPLIGLPLSERQLSGLQFSPNAHRKTATGTFVSNFARLTLKKLFTLRTFASCVKRRFTTASQAGMSAT